MVRKIPTELKKMSGYGDTYEIRIPASLKKTLGIRVEIKNGKEKVLAIVKSRTKLDAGFVMWLNENRNIEITPTYRKWKAQVKGLFIMSNLRIHGGSIVITIPSHVMSSLRFLEISTEEFLVYKNSRGNLEFEPNSKN